MRMNRPERDGVIHESETQEPVKADDAGRADRTWGEGHVVEVGAGSDGRGEWVDAATSAEARGLTEADRSALRDITGGGHREVNWALSQGSIEDVERVAARADAVSRALEKLPVHEGTVLRGSSSNLTDAQIADYEPGDVRVEDRFLHTSVDPEVSDGCFHGNVVWAIESKTGHDVAAQSEVPSESEVMFDKFATFEVLAKDRVVETGQWLIYMREL